MKQVKYWRLKTVQLSAVATLLSNFDETVFCFIHVPLGFQQSQQYLSKSLLGLLRYIN